MFLVWICLVLCVLHTTIGIATCLEWICLACALLAPATTIGMIDATVAIMTLSIANASILRSIIEDLADPAVALAQLDQLVQRVLRGR